MRILCFSMEIRLVYSPCERCSLDSCTGFEVFVPGRQSMALAMNPVFRSANLIRRTVSHFFCRLRQRFLHVLHPNQPMKPTAPFGNKFSVFATTPCRGLSPSR